MRFYRASIAPRKALLKKDTLSGAVAYNPERGQARGEPRACRQRHAVTGPGLAACATGSVIALLSFRVK